MRITSQLTITKSSAFSDCFKFLQHNQLKYLMKDFRQLPGPKGNFFLGNALELNKDLLGFIAHCAEQYGEIVPLRLGLTPACLINKPEYIEQILQERKLFVKNTPDWRTVRTLVGQGLVTSEGDFWLRQRRMIQPVFHQQRINAYAETMVHYIPSMTLRPKYGIKVLVN